MQFIQPDPTDPERIPVIIVRSSAPEDKPEGRSLDVGAWLAEGVVFAGDLPGSASVLRDIAETLRHNANGGPLKKYSRGHSHLLTHVGAVEFTLTKGSTGWEVLFPRGPRVPLEQLAGEVSGHASM